LATKRHYIRLMGPMGGNAAADGYNVDSAERVELGKAHFSANTVGRGGTKKNTDKKWLGTNGRCAQLHAQGSFRKGGLIGWRVSSGARFLIRTG